jgi:hypothetical protein
MVLAFLYCLAKKSNSVDDLISKYFQHKVAIIGDDSIIPRHSDFDNVVQDLKEIGFTLKEEKLNCKLQDCVFTNCNFSQINGQWYPKPNFDKIRASIFYHFKQRSWRLAYAKCNAYYVLSFLYPTNRAEAEELSRWILYNKSQELINEHSMDMFMTYGACISTKLKDNQIRFMWTGAESDLDGSESDSDTDLDNYPDEHIDNVMEAYEFAFSDL